MFTFERVKNLTIDEQRQLAVVMASCDEPDRLQEFVEFVTQNFSSMDHNRRAYILARNSRDIVGFIRLWHSPHTGEWYNDGMVVLPQHRRRGIGGKLLKRAVELARQMGAESVVAQILNDNAVSIRLHEQKGFAAESSEYLNSYGQLRKGCGRQFRLMLDVS